MTTRFMDFRRKEIINVTSGLKVGYVDDVLLNTETAAVESILVYGRPRFFGLFGSGDDLLIKWEDIEVIGEDTILVRNDGTLLSGREAHGGYFGKLFG